MQPNSDQQRGLQVPSSRGNVAPPNSRQAAANLMRQQINTIYDTPQPNEVAATTPNPAPAASSPSPVHGQTHDNLADIKAEEKDAAIQAHWQKYHSAWQQYYQMYYERYYQSAVQKHLIDNATAETTGPEKPDSGPQELTKEQAVGELRNELLKKVQDRTKKIRKSRHFMPAVVAVLVAFSFIFLQYNQIIFANVMAYTTPASLETTNSYASPDTDVAVGPDPLITIPKVAVQAPVVYGLTTLEESVVEAKLQNGAVHYPIPRADAVTGQVGNTVILGHSANDVFAAGDYKFLFLRLEQLQKNDYFYLNYQGKRYTYIVTETKVITPSQVDQLIVNNGKPMATLVTCVPVGTSKNRLLVIGEQRSPDPTKAATANQNTNTGSSSPDIGGGTKSFFERLFSN